MKRPKSIYFLTFAYLLVVMFVLALITAGQKGFPGFRVLKSPLSSNLSFMADKAILIAVGIFILSIAVGIWRGASWARNLSLLSTGLISVISGTSFLKIFTIFSAKELTGFLGFLYILDVLVMLISAFLFIITLRPEIGRFCKIFPEKQRQ